jgi:hypothetical protein
MSSAADRCINQGHHPCPLLELQPKDVGVEISAMFCLLADGAFRSLSLLAARRGRGE